MRLFRYPPRRMMMFAALLLAALFPATPAFSTQPQQTRPVVAAPVQAAMLPTETTRFVYLTPRDVAFTQLPQPPQPKSKAWKADIGKIIQMQKYAAIGEIAAARFEQTPRPELMTPVLGVEFTRARLPKTFALLDNAMEDAKAVTKLAKDHWRLPRPYVADRRVKLLINPLPSTNFAYPSDHASFSLVLADILGDLAPEAASMLQNQASRIANRRIIAGVHSPHDITGGRVIGAAIYQKLQEKPAFQADLAAARQEMEARGYRWAPPGCRLVKESAPPARKNWKSFKSRVTE